MKMRRTLYFVPLCLLLQAASSACLRAQSATHAADAAVLASLDRWKAAVVMGNQQSLVPFYASLPPARTQTAQGTSADPSAEPRFWSALAAQGISGFNPKVLEVLHPERGAVLLDLRVEFDLRTSSGVQSAVMSVAQVWADLGGEWRIVATQRGDIAANPARTLPQPSKPNTNLYPPPEKARSEIAAALALAAKDHKRVILVFGGNWCYDCHVLDATFHSKDIAPLVAANYHVVHINVGEEGDQNLDLANYYGIPLTTPPRVPSLAVLDSDGRLVFAQKQGEFDNSARFSPADVTAFLKKWAPPHQS